MSDNNSFVLLSDLAEEFGIDRSNVRKYVLKRGFSFIRLRSDGSKGGGRQQILALSTDDANLLRQIRENEGFSESTSIVTTGKGYFYIVQPVPELDTKRIKLGYAIDVSQRLEQYKTICPTAIVMKSWACLPAWERAAIDSITRVGCIRIGIEVFGCDDLEALLDRAERFFEQMPAM